MKISVVTRYVLALVIGLCLLPLQMKIASAETANDRYINNQTHLKQIKADQAWDVRTSSSVIIAVLDSGVNVNHPDLKDNLLPGINLDPDSRSYMDNNGHGTMTTGILAAKGNNGIGVSGVLWDAKVLPIKVLDRNGTTVVNILAQGIRVAVDHKAKVILMSVSNLTPSKALEDAVNYAESRGVVLVAASGNEGSQVAYPGAYPTVISVGAVNEKNIPIYQSNYGNELKIMAPGWNIFTTKMGGSYGTVKGTSAAAPQVAAAAAMILSEHPNYSPLDVRQLLYYTATHLGGKSWDPKTGYGLLNVNIAVRTSVPDDISEPNNSRSTAKAFPIETQLRAVLNARDTVDWYYTDIPYEGKLTLESRVQTNSDAPLAATFYQDGDTPVTYYLGNGSTTVSVNPGRYYIKFVRSDQMGNFSYTLTSRFTMAPDRYEYNDDQKLASPLPPGNRVSVVGNFHKPNDMDWFSYYVRDYGKLNVTLSVDNLRADPVLYITKGNQFVDKSDDGERLDPTEKSSLDVSPGKYFMRVSDYSGNQITGTYRLDVDYTPERKDLNEPNDTYRLATKLGSGTLMTGTFPTRADVDWFSFQLSTDSYITIQAPYIPVKSGVQLALYSERGFDYALFYEDEVAQLSAKNKTILGWKLPKGTYYIRLTNSNPFKYDTYRIVVKREPLYNGYRDISTHWAKADISYLSSLGIVKGYSDYTFKPNQAITRAQFSSLLIRSLNRNGIYPSRSSTNPFMDLRSSHWAYNDMLKAYKMGILKGYPNERIKPDQYITRAEMAVMVARAKDLYTYSRDYSSFIDVKASHWASPAIESLYSHSWVKGDNYSRFHPNANATRAEMVVLLRRAFSL
ncbi:S8 family peptidase [Brevibacillus ginsengisoli]|uniref:S8 family peptidase n=1 Tax=Brevibacillus ginsengisoli TaxID=363854 RepID=UPI003CFB94EF